MFVRMILFLAILFAMEYATADAVIFSGSDVKTLKYNIDLFGRSKVMGLAADPTLGGGQSAPLGSIGMNYLTGIAYVKTGAGNTAWAKLLSNPLSLSTEVSGTLGISNGGTGGSATPTLGAVAFGTGLAYSFTAQGSSGQLLQSQGASIPVWTSALYPQTFAAPAMMVGNTTDTFTTISASTANRVLRTNGSAISFSQVALGTDVSGTLPVTNGGTGLATLTQGDILYSSSADTLSALAKNTSASRYLSNTGTSNNPAWAQVDLTNGVTGALPIANGGTGQITKAAGFDALSPLTTGGDLLYGGASGTGTRLANGSANDVLTSGGGTAAPSWTSRVSLGSVSASNSTLVARDSNAQVRMSQAVITPAAVVTSGGTTTLTSASTGYQYLTGTGGNLKMPVVTTLASGVKYTVVNSSSGNIVVQSSGLNTIKTMSAGTYLQLGLSSNSADTTAAPWTIEAYGPAAAGTANGVGYFDANGTLASTAAGTSGTVLKSVGGTPTWSTAPGVINYLAANPDAELDTTGWATYADAAGTSPVDGTGGAPSATWTRTTSSPLRGTGSFLLTKDAANRQGNGSSYAFSIDSADQAKVMQISFDFIVASGTFVAGTPTTDSDVTVWIYDVTNAVVIQPSSYKLFSNSSTTSDKFIANFQTASNSTSYRLILHIGSTSASAYTLKFDNFAVGPTSYVYGTPITDWQSYTPTGSWTLNSPVYTGKWRRVGDMMEVQADVTLSNTPTSAALTINLPSGYTIDSNKLTTTGSNALLGQGRVLDGGVATYRAYVAYSSSTAIAVLVDNASATYSTLASVTQAVPITFGNTDGVQVWFSAPITGWSSSTQLSSDVGDGRIVAAKFSKSTDQTGVNPNASAVKLTFNQIDGTVDTTGSFNTSTSTYTVPVSGYYEVGGKLQIASTNVLNDLYQIRVYVDGSNSQQVAEARPPVATRFSMNGTSIVYLRAGQTLDWYLWGNGNNSASTLTVSGGATESYGIVKRLAGNQTIAATETIAARYTSASGQSIAPSSDVVFVPTTKVIDTHGAFNTSTGDFTAPAAGLYIMSAMITFTDYAGSDGAPIYMKAAGALGPFSPTTTATSKWSASVWRLVRLTAGQAVNFSISQFTAGSKSLVTDGNYNYIDIVRIGL